MELSESLAKAITNVTSENPQKVIAICGAADLGKTYLSKQLMADFLASGISSAHLTMDSYLIPRAKRIEMEISGYDIGAYDLSSLQNDLVGFLKGKPIEFNEYDHALGAASGLRNTVDACSYLLLDGLHSIHESLSGLVDYSIFIYTTDKQLNEIRHQADVVKRKQSVAFSRNHLESEFNAYKKHVEPYKNKADSLLELLEKWQYVVRQ